MEFMQQHWSGLPFPSLGDLPDPWIQPRSSAKQADSLLTEPWDEANPLRLRIPKDDPEVNNSLVKFFKTNCNTGEQSHEERSAWCASTFSFCAFHRTSNRLFWDRASRGSQPLWSVGGTMRRLQGRIHHFQWKTSGGY